MNFKNVNSTVDTWPPLVGGPLHRVFSWCLYPSGDTCMSIFWSTWISPKIRKMYFYSGPIVVGRVCVTFSMLNNDRVSNLMRHRTSPTPSLATTIAYERGTLNMYVGTYIVYSCCITTLHIERMCGELPCW